MKDKEEDYRKRNEKILKRLEKETEESIRKKNERRRKVER